MLQVRPAAERGATQIDWLDSRHSFSFGGYYDPEHMGFRALRVINDDRVAPGAGFGTHPHRDMEILTYVLDGALEHRDSLGTGSVIRAGDLQKMSAGTGIRHSEFNASRTDPVHFLQIWIVPERTGLQPGYQQLSFDPKDRSGRLQLVAANEALEGVIRVHQDVRLYLTNLAGDQRITHTLAPGRQGWVHVARGEITVNGARLGAGDGVAISDEGRVELGSASQGEALLFDLA
ncbi:MAG: pirin family protein [Steroidobacteraceae bacterium]